MRRVIFHVDVNSAFLSWSAVKRLQEDPSCLDLRTVPAVVGGDQATRHGIVTAKSIPAKKYGISTAEPVAAAMRKCPGLIVIPSDFVTYRKYSKQFIKVLKKYAPVVEQASIDEAYLDVTGMEERYADLARPDAPFPICLAEKIKNEIRDTLGFTVNVGISENKLLAKMASDFKKPDRIHTLYPSEIPEKMWPLPIRDLYGCGKQTAARLTAVGIDTIGKAAAQPQEYLQSLLGEKAGLYIYRSANGISDSPVSEAREEAKSCSNEMTTSHDITLENYAEEMPAILKKLSDKVVGRLKKDGLYARTVSVMVKTSTFQRRSIQERLPDSTCREEVIYETASRLAGKLLLGDSKGDARRNDKALGATGKASGGLLHEVPGIRLVGVGTSDLDHGNYRQMTLMDLMGSFSEFDVPEWKNKKGKEPAEKESGEKAPEGKEPAGNEPREKAPEEKEPAKKEAREKKLEALEAMTMAIRGRYGEDAIHKGAKK